MVPVPRFQGGAGVKRGTGTTRRLAEPVPSFTPTKPSGQTLKRPGRLRVQRQDDAERRRRAFPRRAWKRVGKRLGLPPESRNDGKQLSLPPLITFRKANEALAFPPDEKSLRTPNVDPLLETAPVSPGFHRRAEVLAQPGGSSPATRSFQHYLHREFPRERLRSGTRSDPTRPSPVPCG